MQVFDQNKSFLTRILIVLSNSKCNFGRKVSKNVWKNKIKV